MYLLSNLEKMYSGIAMEKLLGNIYEAFFKIA